jgi:hypothetical protein
MTTTSFSRRVPGLDNRAGAILLVGLACVVGLFAGRLAISHYGKVAAEAMIGIPLLIAVFPRPLAALMLLLALLASVFAYDVLPRPHLPGNPPLNIADYAAIVAVGGTLWRRPWRTWPPAVRRFSAGLALLMVLALVPSIKLALQGHAGAREALTGYKVLASLAVALIVVLELSSAKLWGKLLGASIAFAAVVAALSLLAAASGGFSALLTHYNPSSALSVSVDPSLAGTSRIRLPGLFFVYAMTVPTLAMVLTVRDRWRLGRIVALCLMIGAIGVSLNRNMYFGLVVAVLVTVVLGGPRLRHRFLIIAVAGAITLAIIVQSAVIPAVATQVTKRAQSALSSQVLASGSAQARADEFSHAFDAISANPWYGVGWYQNYGAYVFGSYRGYVEDWYLHLTTDMGVPVALAFLLIPWIVLAYGLKKVRIDTDPVNRAMIAAGIGSVIGLLLSCLVGTYLQDPGTMAVFGIACGFVLVAGMRAKPTGVPAVAGVPALGGSAAAA